MRQTSNPLIQGALPARAARPKWARAAVLMELTWIAITASLLMGGGGLLIFIWSVRSHQFKSFEDVKYQVFWSDPQEPAKKPAKEQQNGSSTKNK